MTTRRTFLSSAIALPGLMKLRGKLAGLMPALALESGSREDVTRFVKLAVGTGGHGHTYPGATLPFGAVQLSPDTYNKGWDWCSGYHYSDDSIMGFSHTHLSGTGVGDMIAVIDRLSLDDQFRNAIVSSVQKNPSDGGAAKDFSNPKDYYDLLGRAGLVSLPFSDVHAWGRGFAEPRKWPGMFIAILLLSLGAPFWYNALNQLLKLRSALAQKDDAQRTHRQGTDNPATTASGGRKSELVPNWVKGESGDLTAEG